MCAKLLVCEKLLVCAKLLAHTCERILPRKLASLLLAAVAATHLAVPNVDSCHHSVVHARVHTTRLLPSR